MNEAQEFIELIKNPYLYVDMLVIDESQLYQIAKWVAAEREQARAAGRAEMANEAKERLNAIADTYSMQADKINPEVSVVDQIHYYKMVDRSIALREGASAIEALREGGKEK